MNKIYYLIGGIIVLLMSSCDFLVSQELADFRGEVYWWLMIIGVGVIVLSKLFQGHSSNDRPDELARYEIEQMEERRRERKEEERRQKEMKEYEKYVNEYDDEGKQISPKSEKLL